MIVTMSPRIYDFKWVTLKKYNLYTIRVQSKKQHCKKKAIKSWIKLQSTNIKRASNDNTPPKKKNVFKNASLQRKQHDHGGNTW